MRMYNPKLRFGLWGGVSIYVDTLSTLLGSLLLLSSHAFTMTGSGVLDKFPFSKKQKKGKGNQFPFPKKQKGK
jgi:hypothetical protein